MRRTVKSRAARAYPPINRSCLQRRRMRLPHHEIACREMSIVDGKNRPAPDVPDRGARERILDAAYALFSRHGVRAIGIDRVVAEAGVAKMTLYRHFASKDELMRAVLELRERRWTREWLEAQVEQRAPDPGDRLLTVFDVLGEWFAREDYEGCTFIRTVMELQDGDAAVYREAVQRIEHIREMLRAFAEQAGADDPDELSYQVQILMMGAIVSASRGDREAARRARPLAALALAQRRH
jgi:AcrR family transcriptional regulator